MATLTSSSRRARTLDRNTVLARVVTALLGGWLFTYGLTVFSTAAMVATGIGFHAAEQLLFLLAFVVFLVVFLWSFAARSLWRTAAVLFGAGTAMTLGAWFIQRAILAGSA